MRYDFETAASSLQLQAGLLKAQSGSALRHSSTHFAHALMEPP